MPAKLRVYRNHQRVYKKLAIGKMNSPGVKPSNTARENNYHAPKNTYRIAK
jgi:hypothetical protein